MTVASTGLTLLMEALDSLIGDESPAIIKMDVEGGEEEAILGATCTLSKPSLKRMVIETVTPLMWALFARHRFEEYHYDPLKRVLSSWPSVPRSSNTVFVRYVEFFRCRRRDARAISFLTHEL